MAIVKPRPQSEVLEEELEKPSLPPKKVINYKNGPLPNPEFSAFQTFFCAKALEILLGWI